MVFILPQVFLFLINIGYVMAFYVHCIINMNAHESTIAQCRLYLLVI